MSIDRKPSPVPPKRFYPNDSPEDRLDRVMEATFIGFMVLVAVILLFGGMPLVSIRDGDPWYLVAASAFYIPLGILVVAGISYLVGRVVVWFIHGRSKVKG